MQEASANRRFRLPGWVKPAIRLGVFVVVAAGVGHAAWKAYGDIQRQQFSFWEVDPRWLVAAGAIYLVGLAPSWLYWHLVVRSLGQQPTYWETLRGYYISHLGKYVPGKAMVVVLRAGMVAGPRTSGAVAAAAVFVETLTMMAVGAAIAAGLLPLLYHEQTWLLPLALVLCLCAAVPTIPAVFRFCVRMMRLDRMRPEIGSAVEHLNLRLMLVGWGMMAALWLLLGLSLLATIASMPGVALTTAEAPHALALAVCCVALATVAGFLSMLPGGIAVRELVVISLLAPVYGEVVAVVSAILLRMVWLLSELGISTILYLVGRRGVDS
ncbi:MAG: lysylphosphatidylglycerol synthase domain-containing protein [Pirellulaceae bacterium]